LEYALDFWFLTNTYKTYPKEEREYNSVINDNTAQSVSDGTNEHLSSDILWMGTKWF
jgi:hypothetical protein